MMSRTKRNALWAVLLVAAALAAGVYWWMGRAATVEAMQLRLAPLVRTLQFSARVATLSRVDIGSTVTGRVAEVLVREGAQVQKGALLVRLESDELRSQLAQAVASQQQALARLNGLRGTGRSSAQATVAQAQAVVDAAQAEYARTQQLVAQGFLSASRQDEARRLRDVALAQLAGAQSQAQAVTDAGTEVAQARAQVQVAASTVQAAQARLAQTELRAPADAQVLARLAEPGQIVQPGRALLALALAGPTQLAAQVDERFLEQLAVGQEASAVADAYPGQRFAVRVLSISPAVDAQRGAIEVKFALGEQPPPFLRQDMTLSVEVETGRRTRALVLPVRALDGLADGAGGAPVSGADAGGAPVSGAGAVPVSGADAGAVLVSGAAQGIRATVRVVQDGRVEARAVQLGLRTLDAVEVLSGLAEGDVVLLDPRVAPGTRVRAVLVPVPDALARARGARGEDAGSALTNAMGR